MNLMYSVINEAERLISFDKRTDLFKMINKKKLVEFKRVHSVNVAEIIN